MKRFVFSIATTLLLAPCSYAIIDVNENGVSDLWERDFNNGSLFDGSFDPQADDDSDGWSNVKEAAAGTNPFNPNPPDGLVQPLTGHTPEVMSEPDEYGHSYVITPEAVTVGWPTLVGKQYTLLFSPDLSTGSWLPIGDAFIGNGNEVTYGFTISESDKRFWRVAVCDVDSDNDGLTDHEEHLAGTNPATADSDGDGMSDYFESTNGFDPNNFSDAGIDTDNDGLSNLQELILGTDPNSPDDHSDVGDETVVNGSFSEPAIFVPAPDGKGTTGLEATKGETGWNYWAGIPGWKAVQGENVELQTFATGPEDPNVELKAEPEGHRGIQQWIKTRVGVSYLVIFKALPRPYIGDASLNNFEVYADETRIKEISYTGEVAPETVAWETHTAVFTAQQVLTKLSFVVPESNPDDTLGCIVDEIVLLPVDLDIVHPATGELADAKEDIDDGGYVSVQRLEDPADATSDITPKTRLKIHAVSGAQSTWETRLKFNGADRYKIYRDEARTQEVVSESTEFPADADTTLWFHGLKKSEARGGELITMQIKIDDNWIDSDAVKCTIVQSEFLFQVKAFIPYAWTEAEEALPGKPDWLNTMTGNVAKGDLHPGYGDRGAFPGFINEYSTDFPRGTTPSYKDFQNAPFRVCQTVIITPNEQLHATSDIQGERKLYTAPLSETFEKATSVNAAEMHLKMGFMSLSGTAIKTGKPPKNSEDYNHENRTANRVAEVTIEGGGKDGAIPDLMGIPVPFSQIDDIQWRLYLKVWCDTDPLNPKVEFGGKHDSYPAYEIIVIQSDGSFKDIHRVSPAAGALPGPDSLDDSNAINVGRTDTITK